MPDHMIRVAVAGANGYAGMGTVQLLCRHPRVRIVQMTSRSYAGRPFSDVFPLLDLEGVFEAEPDPARVDVIFSCLPHNVGAASTARWLEAGARVIDLSADYRLRDPELYPRWYRQEHPAPQFLERAVFGLPELHAGEIAEAQIVAVPGCYSTCSILATAPAVASGSLNSDLIVDAKSGVSGAGRSASLGVHFGEVDETVSAYAITGHRHTAELIQELALLAPNRRAPRLTFVPHLIPMVRGIIATCYFDLEIPLDRLRAHYREFYAGQPFTQVRDLQLSTKMVSNTNLCLISVNAQGGKAVVTAVLDNLMKGASAQAVECFNLAMGLPRTTGLELTPRWP